MNDELTKNPIHYSQEVRDSFPCISSERLSEIESEYSVKLPEEYKHFLNRFGAGGFRFTEVYTPDAKQGNSLWDDFVYMEHMRGKILPFADNGCGDYYCFRIIDGVCASEVYWADHEVNYSLSDAGYVNFYDFIIRVGIKNED